MKFIFKNPMLSQVLTSCDSSDKEIEDFVNEQNPSIGVWKIIKVNDHDGRMTFKRDKEGTCRVFLEVVFKEWDELKDG